MSGRNPTVAEIAQRETSAAAGIALKELRAAGNASGPDFTRVAFKINVSGSWASLVTCDADRIGEVKAACEVIANAGNGAKFKILDAVGGEIESYGYNKRTGLVCWHATRRGAPA